MAAAVDGGVALPAAGATAGGFAVDFAAFRIRNAEAIRSREIPIAVDDDDTILDVLLADLHIVRNVVA